MTGHLLGLLAAIVVSGAIAGIAYWRGSLSRSGLVAAVIAGALIFACGGWRWGLLLIVFFVSSSLLSKLESGRKRAAAATFAKGGRRDAGQVLANGGAGATFALLSVLCPWDGWWPLFVGAIAAVTADTWATEIGTLARGRPRSILTGRPAAPGTSGAISLSGTAAAFAGATLIAGLAAALNDTATNGWLLAFGGSVAGLLGSLVDSLLGATVQASYRCERCSAPTEARVHRCGTPARLQRGWPFIDNETVNAAASLAGALLCLGLIALFR